MDQSSFKGAKQALLAGGKLGVDQMNDPDCGGQGQHHCLNSRAWRAATRSSTSYRIQA
jgi:hypothetical protein